MERKKILSLYLVIDYPMNEIILTDTSVWVSHLRDGENHLIHLLDRGLVACHPFIVGELACGNLKNREEIMRLLYALPRVDILEHSEVMMFIGNNNLMGVGIGYVDVHLLGASILSNIPLWTFDKALAKAAKILNIEYVRDK